MSEQSKSPKYDALVERLDGQDDAESACNSALAAYKELEAEIAELQHNLKNWGTIEIAIRNPAVAESMRHWECRAEKAEAELKALTARELVATMLCFDPEDERDGFWLSFEDKRRLGKLPAGTKLYAAIRGEEGK